MKKPILHVFLISHYCEKARWALDLCGVDYRVNFLSPVNYVKTAKALGLKRSALPILETSSGVIQGSAKIIAWANEQPMSQDKERPKIVISEESIALEKRLDDVLGIHVRRWFYSESLLDCPQTIKPVFANGLGVVDKAILSLAWPKVVATMIKLLDLGKEQEIESKARVITEVDWLDSLLSDGRPFLVGNSLSNADITAASLMAPMFGPESHPASRILTLPPRAASQADEWRSRPFAKWLITTYEQHRTS